MGGFVWGLRERDMGGLPFVFSACLFRGEGGSSFSEKADSWRPDKGGHSRRPISGRGQSEKNREETESQTNGSESSSQESPLR